MEQWPRKQRSSEARHHEEQDHPRHHREESESPPALAGHGAAAQSSFNCVRLGDVTRHATRHATSAAKEAQRFACPVVPVLPIFPRLSASRNRAINTVVTEMLQHGWHMRSPLRFADRPQGLGTSADYVVRERYPPLSAAICWASFVDRDLGTGVPGELGELVKGRFALVVARTL